MSAKIISSGLMCLLLTAAAAPARADSERTNKASCQSSKGKGKARGGARAGRGSKAKPAAESTPARETERESESDSTDDLAGLDDDAPKPKEQAAPKPQPAPPKPEVRAQPAREEEPADEPADEPEAPLNADDAEQVESAPEPESASEEGTGPSIAISPYAGFGIATRSVRMPSSTGALEIAPGVTPAAEVGLHVAVWPSAPFSFFVHLVYQSALGFSVKEPALLSLEKEMKARSERVALEIAPRWRLANGKFELGIPVGATVRTLWAEAHMSLTPSYSLVGPHVRAELKLALSEMLSLRLAPELHYILAVDEALAKAGVSSQGPAFGGDASLELQFSQVWSFRIHYRESHALLAATRGSVSFQDVERYLTLRAVGSF